MVPNLFTLICTKTSNRRRKTCITSHINVGRLGTLLDGMPSVCLTNYLCSYVMSLYVLFIVSIKNGFLPIYSTSFSMTARIQHQPGSWRLLEMVDTL